MPGPPDEMVSRFQPTVPTSAEDAEMVQMNVRIPRGMLRRVDDRRKRLGDATDTKITRDEWIRRVCEWALYQPPGTPVRPTAPRRRTR